MKIGLTIRDNMPPAGILCQRPPVGVSKSGELEPIIVDKINAIAKTGVNSKLYINKNTIDENKSPVDK